MVTESPTKKKNKKKEKGKGKEKTTANTSHIKVNEKTSEEKKNKGREKKKAAIPTQVIQSSTSSSSSALPPLSESKQRFPVGTRFFKEFDGFGVFGGKVVELYEDEEGDATEVVYRVAYDDGDEEDLNHREIDGFIARTAPSK